MTAYQMVGTAVLCAIDTPETISIVATTNNPAGNKNITFLKVTNASVTDVQGITVSLTAPVMALDMANTTIVEAGGSAFVQVAAANYTGPVYVRITGAAPGAYVQPVAIVN